MSSFKEILHVSVYLCLSDQLFSQRGRDNEGDREVLRGDEKQEAVTAL